ncbi:MAG: hypothetical protein ACP5FR_02975 [Candidatus Micrarchaeia archaeon]
MAEDNIIKKLAFHLAKKHLAGFTTSSALDAVRSLNGSGMLSTITFLNEHTTDQLKARYNTTAYIQLARELYRLHLNADISVRPGQVGYNISTDEALRNLGKILDSIKEGNGTLWLENGNIDGVSFKIYSKLKHTYSNMGVEIRPEEIDMLRAGDKVAIRFTSIKSIVEKPNVKNIVKTYSEYINRMVSKRVFVKIIEKNHKVVEKLAALPQCKSNLIFELPLGYERKVNLAGKKVQNVSVYVPYGKDWVPYIISTIAEGKVKRVASALLNGESKEGKENARKK